MATTVRPKSKPKPKPKTAKTATKATEVKPRATKRPTAKATKAKATEVKPKAKANASAAEKTTTPRELNVHGFTPGGDSALIVDALVAGGASRKEVNENAAAAIEKANGLTTRSGGEKNIPSLTSAILSRLRDRGYTIEESWRVVPPADIQDQMKKEASAAKRRATRAAKK